MEHAYIRTFFTDDLKFKYDKCPVFCLETRKDEIQIGNISTSKPLPCLQCNWGDRLPTEKEISPFRKHTSYPNGCIHTGRYWGCRVDQAWARVLVKERCAVLKVRHPKANSVLSQPEFPGAWSLSLIYRWICRGLVTFYFHQMGEQDMMQTPTFWKVYIFVCWLVGARSFYGKCSISDHFSYSLFDKKHLFPGKEMVIYFQGRRWHVWVKTTGQWASLQNSVNKTASQWVSGQIKCELHICLHVYMMKYHPVLKRKRILLYAITWIGLEDSFSLRKISKVHLC